MIAIDLFAGAGGLSEGFRRIQNNHIIAHVEMDSAACLTLKTREVYYYLKADNRLHLYVKYMTGQITREELYQHVPSEMLESVINKEITDETCPGIFDRIDRRLDGKKVDIIIGGPPCQAYSLVGRGRDKNSMENDPRNFLYKQYLKFIECYRPKVFVFENVGGLLTAKTKEGKVFPRIQEDMKNLGYNIEYQLLNAADFNVPQNRKRIILIGSRLKNFKYPQFHKIENNCTTRKLFSDLPEIQTGGNYPAQKHDPSCNPLLRELHISNSDFPYLTQHYTRKNNKRDLKIYRLCVESMNSDHKQIKYNELPDGLKTHKKQNVFLDRFKVIPFDGLCHTLVAHICKDGHYYIHPDIKQNRSISVREAARIQTFPDDFYFENSRTSAYKQIGNAVPPLMAEAIAKGICSQLEKIDK